MNDLFVNAFYTELEKIGAIGPKSRGSATGFLPPQAVKHSRSILERLARKVQKALDKLPTKPKYPHKASGNAFRSKTPSSRMSSSASDIAGLKLPGI
jgi:hypothetical protein